MIGTAMENTLSFDAAAGNAPSSNADRASRKGESSRRRNSSSAESRDEARVREARRAFRDFHVQCFWYWRPDMQVTLRDVPEIAAGLRRNGGREGFLVAGRLCR